MHTNASNRLHAQCELVPAQTDAPRPCAHHKLTCAFCTKSHALEAQHPSVGCGPRPAPARRARWPARVAASRSRQALGRSTWAPKPTARLANRCCPMRLARAREKTHCRCTRAQGDRRGQQMVAEMFSTRPLVARAALQAKSADMAALVAVASRRAARRVALRVRIGQLRLQHSCRLQL